jgi:hypothetical protein
LKDKIDGEGGASAALAANLLIVATFPVLTATFLTLLLDRYLATVVLIAGWSIEREHEISAAEVAQMEQTAEARRPA